MKNHFRTALFVLITLVLLSCQTVSIAAITPTPIPGFTPVPLPAEITDSKGLTMRLVPAGEFIMGSDDDKSGEAKPAHTVMLDSFYMDIYEVTRIRYKECVANGVCSEPGDVPSLSSFYAYPNYPMAVVDWNQSKTYCEWRGARLPTEAEWEKAARGTDGRTYPWGEEFDPAYVNVNYDYQKEPYGPAEVGTYEKGQSPYGMYDMSGNVWEWVSDPYIAYPGNQGEGVFWPTQPVLRGGSWFSPDSYVLRTWFRYTSIPQATDGSFGFRCAVSADLAVSMPILVSPTPFETINPNPKMKKDHLPNLLLQGSTVQTLRSLAKEKYSDDDYASRTEFIYIISLDQSKELVWHWYWCAKDETILAQNFEHIAVTFSVNEQKIPLGELVQDINTGTDSACRAYYATLYDWPVGTHHLTNSVTIDQLINDGWSDYSAGNRIYRYFVSVKP